MVSVIFVSPQGMVMFSPVSVHGGVSPLDGDPFPLWTETPPPLWTGIPLNRDPWTEIPLPLWTETLPGQRPDTEQRAPTQRPPPKQRTPWT